MLYRVIHSNIYMGWLDSDIGSSPGLWAATVATYCPSRQEQHSKSKSTQTMYLIVLRMSFELLRFVKF